VFQRHKPVEYEAIEISIHAEDEQFHNSNGWDQDSTNCKLIQSSVRRIKVIASHEPNEISRGVHVPVSYKITEFSANKPEVSVYQESGQHSINRFQIPINHQQAELTADESLVGLGHKSVLCLTLQHGDLNSKPCLSCGTFFSWHLNSDWELLYSSLFFKVYEK
jgi:hypothetical protein